MTVCLLTSVVVYNYSCNTFQIYIHSEQEQMCGNWRCLSAKGQWSMVVLRSFRKVGNDIDELCIILQWIHKYNSK